MNFENPKMVEKIDTEHEYNCNISDDDNSITINEFTNNSNPNSNYEPKVPFM